MTAAWRASTCTIEPAAARTSLLLMEGAAPLEAETPVSSSVLASLRKLAWSVTPNVNVGLGAGLPPSLVMV